MPRYGFNFLWMFSKESGRLPEEPNLRELDLLAEMGLDFVRVPADYRFWTKDFDYLHPDEAVLAVIDRYLEACRARKLHMCLNIHRAPGYCINRPELERHNLWTDPVAQDAFAFLWEMFAKRYRGVPSDSLSFDLLNEPPSEGQRGFTRAIHEQVMRRTVAAIRAVDAAREIVLDGVGAGNQAIPELADLGAVHSGRGYQPFSLTHYQAPWCAGTMDLPVPVWPGLECRKKSWGQAELREFYAPWRAVERRGVRVHIGEFGCFNQTPNEVALAWFADLLALFKEFRWGYSLWNFRGSFGIIEHGRPGTVYQDWHGHQVDRALLDLYLANRVGD